MKHNRELMLPAMRRVHQEFDLRPKINVVSAVDSEWQQIRNNLNLRDNARIAIGVGSRGIDNIVEVVRTVAAKLKACGCRPFVTPAMGSHGGATADGQIKVLAHLGITDTAVGVPVEATMEVESVGEIDGIPLFLDRLAYEADGIVLINRIKLHTDFSGPTESGIIKMMAIGLGNQFGADHYHQLAVVRDMHEIFSKAGQTLIQRTNFLFGVGLVENQEHQTVIVKAMTADGVLQTETELLQKARTYFPRLPLDTIDLLIVDELGKDISGAGMDPNVTGRIVSAVCSPPAGPEVSRILVRDLTNASEGNAIGIGSADFVTRRLLDKVDLEATAINCLTSCSPEDGRLPLVYPTDRQAIAAALMTIRPHTLENVKIAQIKNTLELSKILVSKGCLQDLEGKTDVRIDAQDLYFEFDNEGNLVSILN